MGLPMGLRILLGNEFGAGNGHAFNLRILRDEILKLRPGSQCRMVLPPNAIGATVQEAPDLFTPEALRRHGTPPPPGDTLAYGICGIWFAQPGRLAKRLAMWKQQIDDFKPDVVIADYAPSLTLAARGQVPSLVVGNGYSIPPPEGTTFPTYRKMDPRTTPVTEDVWLLQVNEALNQIGSPPIDNLPAINAGTDIALMTIPLFDAYWRERKQDYLGILHPGGSPVPSSENDGKAIAYFSMPLHAETIVNGLLESGIPTLASLGVATEHFRPRLAGSNVTLVEKPFNLSVDLPGRGIAVHAGSLGFSGAAVYAGLPQVGLFQHDEGAANCETYRIAQIGLARYAGTVKPQEIADMMHKAMAATAMRNFAHALSDKYAHFRYADPAVETAKRALKLVN
jgi:rhamnosyltransferase subunit B